MKYLGFSFLFLLFACERVETYSPLFEIEGDVDVLNQRIEMINQPLEVLNNTSLMSRSDVVCVHEDESLMSLTPEQDCSGCTRLITEDQTKTLTIDEGEIVGVVEGVTVNGGIKINGGTLIVCGDINTGGVYGSGGTIIINSLGTINSTNFYMGEDLIVANYGELLFAEGKGLTLKGQLENYSSIIVERISQGENSKLYNAGEISVVKDIALSGMLVNESSLILGNNFYINSTGLLKNYCAVEVGSKMSLNGQLWNASYIMVNSTFYVNSHKGFKICSNSLIEVSSLIVNDDISNVDDNFGLIYYRNKLYLNGGVVDEDVIITNNKDDAYVPVSACNPGFGSEPKFVLVGELSPPSIDGVELSATSVQVADGFAYVSYHLHGESYAAAIDVLDVSSLENLSFVQQFSSPDYDFNELKIAKETSGTVRKMWVIGAQNEGADSYRLSSPAALFEFNLEQGSIADEGRFSIYDLLGSSGNAICFAENELIAVSGSDGGLSVIDEQKSELQSSIVLSNAKYLSYVDGNVLCLTASEINSTMLRYKAGQYNSVEESVSFEPIYPVDGKLVLYVDAGKAYVASGSEGLNVFSINDLSDKMTYQYNSGYVNGVTTDDQFVYLANGPKGLTIINKRAMTLVGNYSFEGSANFVTAEENGLIFLANGRGGLKIIYREQ